MDADRDPSSKVKRREEGEDIPKVGPNGGDGYSLGHDSGPISRNKMNLPV